MSTTIGTLRSTESEKDNVDVDLHDDGFLVLVQDDEVIALDHRQRQELSVLLERWPPK